MIKYVWCAGGMILTADSWSIRGTLCTSATLSTTNPTLLLWNGSRVFAVKCPTPDRLSLARPYTCRLSVVRLTS
jgi:hypothetical protein